MDIADLIIVVMQVKFSQAMSHHLTVHIMNPNNRESADRIVNQLISMTCNEDSSVVVGLTAK
jgi:hypothetical protein